MILKKVGKVSYELELQTAPGFSYSLLKKYVADPASIVPLESVVVKDTLTYEEVTVEIHGRQVRRLRKKYRFSEGAGTTQGSHPLTVLVVLN